MKEFLTRRKILKAGAAGLMGIVAGFANILPASARETIGYTIAIKNAHTGETFRGVYRVGGYYVP
ncbi:MAG: Tat pathway signal protein, partial [Alphaproteobacteria bacterium]|nr:Tat pathway signal protein [Alphaproteobacteria bacterium]